MSVLYPFVFPQAIWYRYIAQPRTTSSLPLTTTHTVLYNRNSSVLQQLCVTHYVSAVTVRSIAWHHDQHLPPVPSFWRLTGRAAGSWMNSCQRKPTLSLYEPPIHMPPSQTLCQTLLWVSAVHMLSSELQTDRDWPTFDSLGEPTTSCCLLEEMHMAIQILNNCSGISLRGLRKDATFLKLPKSYGVILDFARCGSLSCWRIHDLQLRQSCLMPDIMCCSRTS